MVYEHLQAKIRILLSLKRKHSPNVLKRNKNRKQKFTFLLRRIKFQDIKAFVLDWLKPQKPQIHDYDANSSVTVMKMYNN